MKIKFIKSPTPIFKLAYFPDDEVVIKDNELCAKLIESGVAVEVKVMKKATKVK